ncbi:MAG: hypothetical protein HYT08_03615 [Candidatus Levybacteria bacterium]|nr:hypothetical protein [Candidatus Levybacteria bacterium]
MTGKVEQLTREIARASLEIALNSIAERTTTEKSLKAVNEQFNIRSYFTGREKAALTRDGAVVLSLGRETLRELRKAGRPFLHLFDGGENMLDTPTRLREVALYVDPLRFFVSNSSWKNWDRQLCEIYEDGIELRRRLNIPTITQIMPEAIDLAQIILQHPEEVKHLTSDDSDRQIRTATSMKTGSDTYVARVSILSGGMLDITSCNVKHGNPYIWAPRIIVPRNHPREVGNSLILWYTQSHGRN